MGGTLWIKDFRIGLDNRKGELALRPGTLVEALNGYITQGGEFTNRKAFVPPGTTLPSGCYGLQPTSSGLLTFGSDVAPAGFPNFALQGALLNYQRLQHASVLAGTAYDGAKHAMTEISFSENFGGLAWVVAKFADGKSYCYYNGSIIYDFIDGLVLPDRTTTTLIATDIIALINRTGRYSAATVSAGILNITGPLNTVYALGITENSAGAIAQTFLSAPVASTAGVTAQANLYIVSGSTNPGTNKVTSITVNGVTVTNASVDWTTSNENTAALLAASINAKTSAPDYTATSTLNKLTIIAALGAGSGPNGFVVITNAAGNVCIGDQRHTFQGTKFSVDHLYVNGADILVAPPFTFGPGNTYTTLSALVAAIAADINGNTTAGTAHGYLCNPVSNVLYFSKAVTSSSNAGIDSYFTITVPVGAVGQVLTDNPISAVGFTVAASPSSITKARSIFSTVQTDEVTVFTPNSPALYTYHWRLVTTSLPGTSENWINLTNPNDRITRFQLSSSFSQSHQTQTTITSTFICDVTDLSGFTVSTNVVTINSVYAP